MNRKLVKCLLCVGMLFCVPAVLSQTAFYSDAVYAAEYDSETIASVQSALNDAGYECGTADGVAGSKTHEAVRQYQEANGLTASGEIDDELLISLGLISETDDVNVDANEIVNESADEPVAESSEDSEDGSLLHLENENGIYDVLGYDYYTLDPAQDILYIFSRYENTTGSTINFNDLVYEYFDMSAYQEGEILPLPQANYSLSYLDLNNPEWVNAVSSIDSEVTEIQSGESVILYTEFICYTFYDDLNIKVEIGASGGTVVLGSYTIGNDANTESGDRLLHLKGFLDVYYDLLGFYFDDSDSENVKLYIIGEYVNTGFNSPDASTLSTMFEIYSFQDRVCLEKADYSDDFTIDTEWGEAVSTFGELEFGESVVCFTPFILSSNSEIEVEIFYAAWSNDTNEIYTTSQTYITECDESVASKLSDPVEFNAESDSLLHIDTGYCVFDLLGYDFDFNEDLGYIVDVLYRFENNSDTGLYTSSEIYLNAYQDGVRLEKKARSSDPLIHPGASVIFHRIFKLDNGSDIELEVSYDDTVQRGGSGQQEESYMIECDESVTSNMSGTVDPASFDSLLQIENDKGIYDLVGCYSASTDSDSDIFYVFSRFENTGDETKPSSCISIEAYQDGEQLEYSNMTVSLNDTEWANTRSNSTYLKPGASMIYYTVFTLSGDSDIEVRISNYNEEDNPLGSYTFVYGEW